ncbi:MAG: ribose 5-phosphate isomerase [Rickettsiaceae bacterium]|nr:ribose 5-phosphate isomerase [Rickettsiaceae bacterium]
MNFTKKISIALGADHAGFLYKQELMKLLKEKNFRLLDCGSFSEEKVDFPDFAHPVCHSILDGEADYGILICGSGIGMSIAANRYSNIRAALCHNEYMAEMAKAHNNSNILVLGARINSLDECIAITEKYLRTSFEGGRHIARIAKIEEV